MARGGSVGVATLESDFDPRGLRQALKRSERVASGGARSIGSVFAVALGNVLANAFTSLTRFVGRAIRGMVTEAIDAIADFERLTATLENFVARELVATGAAEDMAEGLSMSSSRAEELLGWVEELTIKSPFSEQGVQQAFRTALAYGFNIDQAKDLTSAMIDFAAGTGAGTDAMGRLALALGQVRARGRLAGQEVLQMTEVGLPVLDILAKSFGKTTAEVQEMIERGQVSAEDAIGAIVTTMQTDFGGAAERQATTWAGLMSSFEDAKRIGLREFFMGAAQAIQPFAADLLDWLTGPGKEQLAEWGERLGNFVARMLELGQVKIPQIIEMIRTGDIAGLLGTLGVPDHVIDSIMEWVTFLDGEFRRVMEWMQTNVPPAVEEISRVWEQDLLPALQTFGDWVMNNKEDVLAFFVGFVAVITSSAFIGVLTTLGALLASLASPVLLIALAVGLLAAAWVGDWGGIRTFLVNAWEGTIQPALQSLSEWLQVVIPAALDWWQTTFDRSLSFVVGIIEWWRTNFERSLRFVQGIVDWWVSTFQGSLALVQFVVEAIRTRFEMAMQRIRMAIQFVVNVWQTILLPALQAVWTFLQVNIFPLFQALANLLGAVFGLALTVLAGLWQNVLLPALTAVWTFIQTNLMLAWQSLVTLFQTVVGAALIALSFIWTTILQPALQTVWSFIQTSVLPIFRRVGTFLSTTLSNAITTVAGFFEGVFKGALDAVWGFIQGNVLPILEELADFVTGQFSKSMDTGKGLIDGLRDTFENVVDAIRRATDWINRLADRIDNLELPPWLTPGSPTPFEMGLRGINAAMQELNRTALPSFAQNMNNVAALQMATSPGERDITEEHHHWELRTMLPDQGEMSLREWIRVQQMLQHGGR